MMKGRKVNSMLDKKEQILQPPLKRSITIAGHRTSISLEQPFWEALQSIAKGKDMQLATLVTQIDKEPRNCGLSCVLRVYVLRYYQEQSHSIW